MYTVLYDFYRGVIFQQCYILMLIPEEALTTIGMNVFSKDDG